MSLLDRLLSKEDPNLAVHQFTAAVAEYKRGAITGQQVIDAFDLSAAEAISLQEFLDNMDAATIDREKVHDVLLLGVMDHYTKIKVKIELGLSGD